MKSLAVISSGFLRNYRHFIKSGLCSEMKSRFGCHFYISTWEEDGYGTNRSMEYTDSILPEEQIRDDFGDGLKFLKRLSFKDARAKFKYDPVRPLLSNEPHVLEKYRSKFYSLKQAEVPAGYDVYFHVRFDVQTDRTLADSVLACLESYDSSLNAIYTNRHIFGRRGCFGDILQVMDHDTLSFMQRFYERLFEPRYLELDIPKVPEKVLLHYFRSEAPGKKVIEMPCGVKLNRSRSQ